MSKWRLSVAKVMQSIKPKTDTKIKPINESESNKENGNGKNTKSG